MSTRTVLQTDDESVGLDGSCRSDDAFRLSSFEKLDRRLPVKHLICAHEPTQLCKGAGPHGPKDLRKTLDDSVGATRIELPARKSQRPSIEYREHRPALSAVMGCLP